MELVPPPEGGGAGAAAQTACLPCSEAGHRVRVKAGGLVPLPEGGGVGVAARAASLQDDSGVAGVTAQTAFLPGSKVGLKDRVKAGGLVHLPEGGGGGAAARADCLQDGGVDCLGTAIEQKRKRILPIWMNSFGSPALPMAKDKALSARLPLVPALTQASCPITELVSQQVSKKQTSSIPDIVSQSIRKKQPPTRTWPPPAPKTLTPPTTSARTSTISALRSCSKSRTSHPIVWQELTRDTDVEIKMTRVEDFGTARTTRRSRNKQEQNSEVASSIEEPTLYEQDQAKMKMTSPKKVKTEHANRRPKPTVESPSLKRLQTPKFDKIAPGTSPTRQKLRNSQFKTQNFKQLLLKWEDISTITLTPAVYKKPDRIILWTANQAWFYRRKKVFKS